MITNYILTVIIVLLLSIIVVFFAKTANNRILLEQNKRQQETLLHQKELLKISYDVQEKERKRIAHELHDDIGGKMHLLNIRLANELPDEEGPISILVQEIIESTRQISHDLYPPMLEELGLEFVLNEMCGHLMSAYKLCFSWKVATTIPLQLEIQLLRVIQEFLSNSIKHSGAKSLSIQFRTISGKLYTRLSDDGQGVDLKLMQNGLGISGINSRLELINASYRWNFKKGVSLINSVDLWERSE